jgi:hypothetical protein
MSGGYLGAPLNVYDPIGYNPFFGQQVTGANFGFMPAPMSFTPFGMPNYMAMPDYMYNRGSYMNQSLLQPPMMQQGFNPFGSFNQPMMQPPQSPSQLGIGEPAPEFTPMQSNIYQPPVQTVTPVEDKPPAFKPYLDWTSFSVIGKKDYVPGASNRRFRDRLIGYESDGTPRYERQTVYSVPGWSPYSGGSNPKVKYGTMPID